MIINVLKSTRLAQALLVSLLLVMLLSILIPQKSIYSAAEIAVFARRHPAVWKAAAALSLTDIFRSPLFIALAAALALNLIFCIGRRAIRIFLPEITEFEVPAADGAVAAKLPAPRRGRMNYRLRFRFIGSTIFHIGILTVMAGLLASEMAGFMGAVAVTEGQSIIDRHDTYGKPWEGPAFFEGHGMFSVKLDRLVRRYSQDGHIAHLAARVSVKDNKTELRREIRINHPLEYGGAVFVIKDNGFSPRFTLRRKKTGARVFKSYVNIKTYADCTSDSFNISAAGLRIDTGFRIPYKSERVAAPRNPVFGPGGETLYVRIVQPGKAPGGLDKILYFGPLMPGESVSAGGFELSVDDVRSWVSFKVTRDPGKIPVFIGFWACTAGLALRFYASGNAPSKKAGGGGNTNSEAKTELVKEEGAPVVEYINSGWAKTQEFRGHDPEL